MLAKIFYTFLCDMHFEAPQVVAIQQECGYTQQHTPMIYRSDGEELGGGGDRSRSACPVGVKTHKILGNGKQQNI
jgi:hypothetical protein